MIDLRTPVTASGETPSLELLEYFRDLQVKQSYTVATLPDADGVIAGTMVYVSNETGGAVMAFSDGTDWRRVTDRAVVS